jgi:hypothetical protein
MTRLAVERGRNTLSFCAGFKKKEEKEKIKSGQSLSCEMVEQCVSLGKGCKSLESCEGYSR